MTPAGIVILGASHSAVALAAELRSAGHDGPLALVGEEEGLPYHRPHLSKECLGSAAADPGPLRPVAFFADRGIALHRAHVTAIDRAGKALVCADGTRIAYDRLVLATGARARALPASIAGADRALILRDRADLERLATGLGQARNVAVIGGGLIGLEVAAAAAGRGLGVTVLEGADRIMARSLYPALAAEVQARHAAAGIDLRLCARVEAITPQGVVLAGEEVVDADLVLAAVGSAARDELARAAGLATDAHGIVVDHTGATSDPAILALGDCACWPEGAAVQRHESVAATQWQAKTVAAALTGGTPPAPAPLRLWSTQGTMRLQMAGPVLTDARVALDEVAGGLLLRAFHDGRLVAVQALDAPRPFNAEVARIGAPESGCSGAAIAATTAPAR